MKRPLAKLLRAVRRRSVDLTAEPLSGVLDLGGGRFEATDRDAALLLRASSLPHGWVELDFETERPDEADVPPLLYFDSGNGFHLSDCVRLPPPSLGRIRALARLPQQVLRLRFNPLTARGTMVTST